jgi:hypothetical protein
LRLASTPGRDQGRFGGARSALPNASRLRDLRVRSDLGGGQEGGLRGGLGALHVVAVAGGEARDLRPEVAGLRVLDALDGASFVPTGAVPRFYSELEARGIPADQAVFR